MATAEFNYKGKVTSILCSENEKMEEICKRFATKIQTDITNLMLLYSGNTINLHNSLSQIMNNIDKQRKVVSILVNTINTITKTKTITNLIKSDIPICPECSETIKFDVNNYQIYLSECRNGHSKFLPINEYEKTQYIDLNKIICKSCGTNKNKVYDNKMYMCYTCNSVLCPLCKNNHDKKHAVVNYDFKNFLCERHYESYNSYCSYCKVNLCLRCQKYHQEQNIISFGNIFPEKDELLVKLEETKKVIDVFKKDIKEIIKKLNTVKENIEILYDIYYKMITKFDSRKRNYETFMSINSFNTNMVFQAVKQINQTNSINNIFNNKVQQLNPTDVNGLNNGFQAVKQINKTNSINIKFKNKVQQLNPTNINNLNNNFQTVQQINQTQDTNQKIQSILSMYNQMKQQNNTMMMEQNQKNGIMGMQNNQGFAIPMQMISNMPQQMMAQQPNSLMMGQHQNNGMMVQQGINMMQNQNNNNKNKKYIGCKNIQSNMNTQFSNSMNNQMVNTNPFINSFEQPNNYY